MCSTVYNDWTKDLKDSTKAILSIKDTVLPKLIRGRIWSVENQDNEILLLIDQTSGIDLIREDMVGLQGIAVRMQWGNDWNTFTIRKSRYNGTKTELEKRYEQIAEGYFYPAFTIQAYFDNRTDNNLLSIGAIKTIDLYNFMNDNPDKIGNNKSDNEFVFVRWSDLNGLVKTIE